MVTVTKKKELIESPPGYTYVTKAEGQEILDRQARKYLGMSGDEFIRRYRAGEINDPHRTEVIVVSMLIPLAES